MGDGRITRVRTEVAAQDAAVRVTRTDSEVAANVSGAAANTTRVDVEVAAQESTPRVRTTRIVVEGAFPMDYNANATRVVTELAGDTPEPQRITREVAEVAADTPEVERISRVVAEAAADLSVDVRASRIVAEIAAAGGSITYPLTRVTRCIVELAIAGQCSVETEGRLPWYVLRKRVLHLLGEHEDALTGYWTQAEIGRYLNDAYRQICKDTKALELIETAETVPGTDEYSLSQYVLQIKRLFLDKWTLPPTTRFEANRKYRGATGHKPKAYIANENNRAYAFDQTPTEEQDVEVWATKLPAEMESTCDAPETPPWSHQGIVFLAASRALRKHGEQRNPALADAYESIGSEYVAMLRGVVANSVGERTVAAS